MNKLLVEDNLCMNTLLVILQPAFGGKMKSSYISFLHMRSADLSTLMLPSGSAPPFPGHYLPILCSCAPLKCLLCYQELSSYAQNFSKKLPLHPWLINSGSFASKMALSSSLRLASRSFFFFPTDIKMLMVLELDQFFFSFHSISAFLRWTGAIRVGSMLGRMRR